MNSLLENYKLQEEYRDLLTKKSQIKKRIIELTKMFKENYCPYRINDILCIETKKNNTFIVKVVDVKIVKEYDNLKSVNGIAYYVKAKKNNGKIIKFLGFEENIFFNAVNIINKEDRNIWDENND